MNFYQKDEVESSQPFSQFSGRIGQTQPSRFFVPETQCTDFTPCPLSQPDIVVPETQHMSEQARLGLNSSPSSSSSGATLLDVATQSTAKNCYESEMFSQNIFAEISSNCIQNDDEDAELTEIVEQTEDYAKSKSARDGSVTPNVDFASARDGSVTPELDFSSASRSFLAPGPTVESTVKKESSASTRILQSEIATQIVKKEMDSEDLRQSQIETQIYEGYSSDEDRKPNLMLMEPTQPLFLLGSRTRLHSKRQAEIKPKTVSLTDFEETQVFAPSPKKMKKCFNLETQPVFVGDTQMSIGGKERERKTINRILLSEEESSGDSFTRSPSKLFFTPDKSSDSPLLRDVDTPEVLPRVPSSSQIGSLLEKVNASQDNGDSVISFDINTEEDENAGRKVKVDHQPMNENKIANAKKPRRRLMKFDMKYEANESDDEPAPIVKAKETLKRSDSNLSKNPKIVEAARKKPESKSKKTETKAKPEEKKVYSFVISNISDPAARNTCVENCAKLGSKLVTQIADADFLLTKSQITFTAKFLAAVCKGIPVVDSSFIEASLKAGCWLDPHDFIICDMDLELKKGFSLKSLLKKTAKKKFLQNYSVFVTNSTLIPENLLSEIIEQAGGEYMKGVRYKPKYENLAMIYSDKDKREQKSIVRKYPHIVQTLDSDFCNVILRQEL